MKMTAMQILLTILERIKIPTPMDCNTFFTFNFSVNGGGDSVKFDMMLLDCNGEGDTAARR
jgi:hypothetical protein